MVHSRFITLGGDPVDGNLATKFTRATDCPAAIAQAGLTYVFQRELQDASGKDNGNLAVSTALSIAFALIGCRMIEKWYGNTTSLKGKCIDTAPDKNTASTIAKYGIDAAAMRSHYLKFALTWGVLDTVIFVATTLENPADMPRTVLNIALQNLIPYTRFITGYRRFDKVVKGEWQIVDMPTPEKLAEATKTETSIRSPVLKPTGS